MTEKQHIIIADANPHMQKSLTSTIGEHAPAQVDTVHILSQLLPLIRLRPPDVLIIDVATFCAGSVDIIEQLSSLYLQMAIIVFSFFSNRSLISIAAGAGATGFLSKESPCLEVIDAIQAVRRGREYYCGICTRLLSDWQKQKKMMEGKCRRKELTLKEIDILRYSSRGLTNAKIGSEMCLSKRTIESCKRTIAHKTNTKKIIEMIQYARERGLIQ